MQFGLTLPSEVQINAFDHPTDQYIDLLSKSIESKEYLTISDAMWLMDEAAVLSVPHLPPVEPVIYKGPRDRFRKKDK